MHSTISILHKNVTANVKTYITASTAPKPSFFVTLNRIKSNEKNDSLGSVCGLLSQQDVFYIV